MQSGWGVSFSGGIQSAFSDGEWSAPCAKFKAQTHLGISKKSQDWVCTKMPAAPQSISNWRNSNLISARADSHICLDISGYKSCIVVARALEF